MALLAEHVLQYIYNAFYIWISILSTITGVLVLKFLYNVSPFHPLSKYPGPFLWRASRIPASYHHACGDLYKCIAAIHAQYGDTVRIAPDELSFSAPSAWPLIYNSRPQLDKSKWHFAPNDVERLPPSMITAPDAEHAKIRRLAGPAFLNAGIAEIEPVLQQYSDFLCSQLAVASSEGSQNLVEWFLWALNDVIGQLALDQEFQCLEKRRMHPWPHFLLSVLKQTAALNQFRRFGLPMQLLKSMMTQKMRDESDSFMDLAKTAINKRLSRDKEESSDNVIDNAGRKKRPDIVGLMLREMKGGERLTEGEIMSNSVLIVGGGAETTSTCLSATFYHLCKTPHAMNKLKNEIRKAFSSNEEITVKATANLPYLKATVDESLRIFPVASYITPRVTPKAGYNINGEHIGGGTYISMGQWYMGRSAKHFEEPEKFKPERWFDLETKGPAGLAVDEVLRPFSLGPRNCIGKLLAIAEARLVIAKLLWNFDIELDGSHETWVEDARFYILWQLQPLKVKLTPVKR